MRRKDEAELARNETQRSGAKQVLIEHDGFHGDVIGFYTTREGKRGIVLQQIGTKVVHVYGERWVNPDVFKGG